MTENAQPTMVEARDLRKLYGTTRAVDGVSFTVRRGEVVGFLGPNGAGKSTTMKMLTGFIKPTGGQARVADVDVAADPLAAQARIGYLPENAPLYDDMMVVDFLTYVAELRQVQKGEQRARLREVADRCGLMSVLGKDIGQLSKGFRQRVGLAQALVHNPDLLILDEPTSGLDPNQIIEIRELMKELGREKTIILSTHILQEVQATCSRIIIINDGRLIADDTPERLRASDAASVVRVVVRKRIGQVDYEAVRALFGALPGVRDIERAEGEGSGTMGLRLRVGADSDPREAVFSAAVANELVLLDMHRERQSLEDTFRRLTQGTGANTHA